MISHYLPTFVTTGEWSYVFSTSDSSSDVLLLSKVRNWENFGSGSGTDPHVMCLSQSEAQNREGIGSRSGADSGSGLGADREWIGSGSPPKVM